MDCLFRLVFPFLIPGLVSLAGCTSKPAVDAAEVAKHRTALTLATEPLGAQSVLDVRAAMYGEKPHDHAHEAAEEAEHASAGHDPDAEHAEEHAEHAEDHAEHEHAEKQPADADHDHAEGDAHNHADDHAATEPATPKHTALEVVMVGTVGGVPNPSEQSHPEFPFVKNQAMFFLADPEAAAEAEDHAHHHASGEVCAFCAAHSGDAALAVVEFKGPNGKPLPVDARELFQLKEKQTVVIRGTARIAPGGMLTVDATGLYARQ